MLTQIETAIEQARADLGDALVAVDVWASGNGLSYASFETRSTTGPMLNAVTRDLRVAAAAGGNELDDLYVLDLNGRTAVVVVCPPRLEAALIVDTSAADLDHLLTETVPAFAQALRSAQDDQA